MNRIVEKKGRWVEQHILYDPDNGTRGNCAQACIASILGLPIHAVPHFAENAASAAEFWDGIEEFVNIHGYDLMMLSPNSRPDGLYLASGMSLRGVYHMVVMRGGSVFHDPHPSKTGLVDIEHVHLLVPFDPCLTK